MGDQLTFDNLSITYIVDEYLENFLSIHEWMTAIGFPKNRTQFSEFRANTSNTPTARLGSDGEIGEVSKATGVNALFSDATLDYNQGATDVEYLTATVDFAYQIYEIEPIV